MAELAFRQADMFARVPGLEILPGFALAEAADLVAGIAAVAAVSPFRHMVTPGGGKMAAAMTACGVAGWVSDRRGYRYERRDPETGAAWPEMPELFWRLAGRAAAAAGFAGFAPDVCLINRYAAQAGMGLHQDRDERDFSAPIVSVSLGLPAVFLWGGAKRTDRPAKIPLAEGDVVVWGGAERRFFHGVAPLRAGSWPPTGDARLNLTFRQAF